VKKVMKMHTPKVKLKSLSRLAWKVRRLLTAEKEFQASVTGQEKIAHEATLVDTYHVPQREIRSAWLNAERRKAEVLIERQKHPQLF